MNLDLRLEDNRAVAMAVVTLVVGGGGITLKDLQFRRTFDSEFIPGWEVPAMWDVGYKGNLPKGVPCDGNFICTVMLKDSENKEKIPK